MLKLFEAAPVACGQGKYGKKYLTSLHLKKINKKNLKFNITFKLKLYYCWGLNV